MKNVERRLSAGEKATVKWVQRSAFAIIAAVVVFGDVMFIKIMMPEFPGGLLRVGAILGAVTTAASVLALTIGKKHWFRPGDQLYVAYAFTGAEVLISVFNVLLASGSSYFFWWQPLAPASPFAALIGWTVIIMVDPSTKQTHDDMEMEDEIQASERAYKKAQHEANMQVRMEALEYHKQYLLDSIRNPVNQEHIKRASEDVATEAIQGVTGRYIPPPTERPMLPSHHERTTDPLAIPSQQ